jgi:hypothetical protein
VPSLAVGLTPFPLASATTTPAAGCCCWVLLVCESCWCLLLLRDRATCARACACACFACGLVSLAASFLGRGGRTFPFVPPRCGAALAWEGGGVGARRRPRDRDGARGGGRERRLVLGRAEALRARRRAAGAAVIGARGGISDGRKHDLCDPGGGLAHRLQELPPGVH